jgi:L-ascorbate metabolism protein UlaG (beta-lactamase superfamily)
LFVVGQQGGNFHVTNLAPPDNGTNWDNIIYVIETGGLRIGFWGDNRPTPAPGVLESLKNLDVLIMNVDGSEHILSYAQINGLLDQLKPKAVIPGHYLSKGAVLPSSSLKPATVWVNTQKNKVNLPSAELLLNKKILEKADRRVYYFGDHFKSN